MAHVGEDHHEAVYAETDPARRRHSPLERPDEVLVHHHGLLVAVLTGSHLDDEALALVVRIDELAVALADLAAGGDRREPLHITRLRPVLSVSGETDCG